MRAGVAYGLPPLCTHTLKPKKGNRMAKHRSRRNIAPLALLLPASAIVLLALGYPIIWQLVTSMQKFGLAQQFGKPPEWVWFANYLELFTTATTWLVVGRSIAFCLVTAAVTMVIGVGLALLMRAVGTVVRVILQVALLLAWATPVVAAMTIWNWMTTKSISAVCLAIHGWTQRWVRWAAACASSG